MKEIEAFIKEFIHIEYKVRLGKVDAQITQDAHDENVKILMNYYGLAYQSMTGGLQSRSNLDQMTEERLASKLDKIVPRKLYLIEQYANASFGEGLFADDTSMYSCFLSSGHKLNDGTYNENFIITQWKGDLKITTIRTLNMDVFFNEERLAWYHKPSSIDAEEGNVVIENGELIKVVKLEEPTQPIWQRDYERVR